MEQIMMQPPENQAVPPVQPPVPKPVLPETARMKSRFSRGGLSVAALYGTIAKGQSISIILIAMLTSLWMMICPPDYVGLSDLLDDPLAFASAYLSGNGGFIGVVLALFLLCQAASWIVGFVMMRLVLPKSTPIEKKNLPFGRFLLAALMCFGVWGVGAVLGNVTSFFGVETESLFSTDLLGKAVLPYLVYAVIGAPILEELTFRKALLDGLHDQHEGYAAVISALLFGLMHGNHMQFFLAFFIGLIFAMVYQRTGRVIYSMILHAMINFTATLPEVLLLYDIDISRGWNIAVLVLIAAGLVVLFVRRRDPLLHAPKCTVPDANRAVYKNLGMRLTRIAGLILIGMQGLMLVLLPMLEDRDPRHLIGLLPLALSFLTVLLLPVFTRRYEAKPETAEPESTGTSSEEPV